MRAAARWLDIDSCMIASRRLRRSAVWISRRIADRMAGAAGPSFSDAAAMTLIVLWSFHAAIWVQCLLGSLLVVPRMSATDKPGLSKHHVIGHADRL
jgi:hypothetical protein